MSEALRLIISKEGVPDRNVEIDHEGLIGRGEDCLIQLEDRAVSRNHARIIPLEGEFKLEKKSRFGKIRVDGAEVNEAICKLGQLIEIGPYLIRVESLSDQSPEPQTIEPLIESDSPQELPALEAAPFELPHDEGMVETQESEGEVDLNVPQSAGELVPEVPFDINTGAGDPTGGAFDVPVVEDATSLLDSVKPEVADSSDFDEGGDGEDRTRVLNKSEDIEIRLTFFPGTDRAASYAIHADRMVFGRSSSCEVPIEDKKASRKHAEIWKRGSSYFIKDLESANGTFLNGGRITESEVQSGDVIRIGDTDILFQAVQAGYEEQAQQFITPQIEETHTQSETEGGQSFAPVISDGLPGVVSGGPGAWEQLGVAGTQTQRIESPEKGPKALLRKFKERWEAVPKQRRFLFIFAMLFLLLTSDFEEAPDSGATKEQKTQVTGVRTFESLNAEQKRFVESQHEIGFQHYKNKEYDKAIFELEKIFQYVDEYKDTKELVRYASEGQKRLKRIEEERKRKEEADRIKKEIDSLTQRAQTLMLEQQFDEAQALFPSILVLDPENTLVTQWQGQIEEWKENERIKEQERQIRERIRKEALDVLKRADVLFEKGAHLEAIRELERVSALEISDERVKGRVRSEIERHRAAIQSLLEPALDEAKAFEDSGEYSKAYQSYERAREINPEDGRSQEGMNRIRRVLHERAQVLYTEGVIAESLSDFDGARSRFEEIRQTIPKDDGYYDKAVRRLERYDAILGRTPAIAVEE